MERKPIEIKGCTIGEGMPKILTSVMTATLEETVAFMQRVADSKVDIPEWRIDFYDAVSDPAQCAADSAAVRAALPDKPILVTLRTTDQGGNITLPAEEYIAVVRAMIEAGNIDIIDIETWIGDAAVAELCQLAKAHGIVSLVSYHNFEGVPSKEWIVNLMTHMLDLGADIPKVAVMAHDVADALVLLSATEEFKRLHSGGCPVLTMAMGATASITRVAGEIFGSDMTFCSLEKASAPGQVGVDDAYDLMSRIHEVLC